MRSISASTWAISFNAAGDSVVLGCWACDAAIAPLTSVTMHAAAIHAFIERDLVSSNTDAGTASLCGLMHCSKWWVFDLRRPHDYSACTCTGAPRFPTVPGAMTR